MRARQVKLLILMTIAILLSNPTNAKIFRNTYVSFNLPEKWDCVLEQTEWVCRPVSPALAPKAIIVLTAKEVGPSDSLQLYYQHLRSPQMIASKSGKPIQSQIYKVEQVNIANQTWIDGMHLSSEVPNYFTRYLATTKSRIAILVTFSAHKLYYSQFSNDFFNAIKSLRVTANNQILQGQNGGADGGGFSGLLGGADSQSMFMDGGDEMDDGSYDGEGSGGLSTKAKSLLAGALSLAGLGIYLLIKKSQKKK